jgi:hypothetical protein
LNPSHVAFRTNQIVSFNSLDVPQQNNPTPSSVSGVQIEDTPSSRASPSRRLQSKSPAPVTPRMPKQKTQEGHENNINKQPQTKSKEKSAHEKKSKSPLPNVIRQHNKSKSEIDTKSIKSQQGVIAVNEKPKLPSIVPKQKTDIKIPNKIKRQVKN